MLHRCAVSLSMLRWFLPLRLPVFPYLPIHFYEMQFQIITIRTLLINLIKKETNFHVIYCCTLKNAATLGTLVKARVKFGT